MKENNYNWVNACLLLIVDIDRHFIFGVELHILIFFIFYLDKNSKKKKKINMCSSTPNIKCQSMSTAHIDVCRDY